MSSVTIQGNPSGTGIFTVASPNSNTNQTIVLPNASGTLLTNSGTEAGAFSTLSVAGNNISAVNSLGFRNRIINGGMVIDQRNAGASVTSSSNGLYFLDRWRSIQNTNSKFAVQQNAGAVTPPVGFTNYLGATSLSAYSVPATETAGFGQAIEGFNVADLAWGTANAQAVTLSFRVYSSLTGTFAGSIQNSAQNRSYPFTFAVSSANTWTTISLTIPGDTTGTWLTNNAQGLWLWFSLGSGANWHGTAGAWQAGERYGVSGQVNVIATNAATFYITGVQLEAGSVATPFERRDYGRELMMCQRYYQRYGAGGGGRISSGGQWSTSTFAFAQVPLYPMMRTVPIFSTIANGRVLLEGTAWYNATGVALLGSESTTNLAVIQLTVASSAAISGYAAAWGGGGAAVDAQFSAEL